MKTLLSVIVCTTLLMAGCMLCGCRRGEAGHPRPAAWPPVSPVCDSLTGMLELSMACDSSAESIDRCIAGLSAEARRSGNRSARARWLYWMGRRKERLGQRDSALTYLRDGMALVDSGSYDYRRMRIIAERLDGTPPVRRYINLSDDERYYSRLGDLIMMANVAQQKGALFMSTLQYSHALRHYQISDSLLNEAGYGVYLTKNRINTSMAYLNCGDSARADSVLRPLLMDPVILRDPPALNLVMRNMHVITGDRRYIAGAYRLLDSADFPPETRPVYEAILSNDLERENLPDSADCYASKGFARLGAVTDLDWRQVIMRSYARKLRREGKTDSLAVIQERIVAALDSLDTFRQTETLGRLEGEREIRDVMESVQMRRQKEKTAVLAIFLIIVVVGAVVVILLSRRNARQKLEHMEFQLATERDRRKLLSLTMMLEEKDGFIDSLRKEIASMKAGQAPAAIDRLENLVARYESGRMTKEFFFESFERLNPLFIPALKKRCPNLPESSLQLACLIVTGLDNKRIAGMLNVRPASINQSRWRLRSRIGLEKEESLEEFLRELCR